MTQRFDPARHHRQSLRLRRYDYTRPGVYFITICTHDRRCLFGDIVNGRMRLNAAGMVAAAVWRAIPAHFPRVQLDAFVVMPNHVHGVVVIAPNSDPTPDVTDDVSDDVSVGATHASPLRDAPRRPDRTSARVASSPTVWRHATRDADHEPTWFHAGRRPAGPPQCSVGAIVGTYKSAVSRRVNQLRDTPGAPIWQRNYYENIVREADALRRIRAYIDANPRHWAAARRGS